MIIHSTLQHSPNNVISCRNIQIIRERQKRGIHISVPIYKYLNYYHFYYLIIYSSNQYDTTMQSSQYLSYMTTCCTHKRNKTMKKYAISTKHYTPHSIQSNLVEEILRCDVSDSELYSCCRIELNAIVQVQYDKQNKLTKWSLIVYIVDGIGCGNVDWQACTRRRNILQWRRCIIMKE